MKRRDEVIGALVFFLIVLAIVCTFALVVLGGLYDKGFKSGQIDALEGRWHYQRVELADGSVTYPKIDPDKAKEPTQ